MSTKQNNIFQSTLPREERPRFDEVCQVSASFQSTLPREERRQTVMIRQTYVVYFNPRSHERSDVGVNLCFCYVSISIHAPTRGATCAVPFQVPLSLVFQSTLPREERRAAHVLGALGVYIFQSTLPREERHQYKLYCL